MARLQRREADMRDLYPLLADWLEADRHDTGLGARVVAQLARYRHERTTGPTWWAVAEWVHPDLELVPDSARRWYASRLINRLVDQGWLCVPDTRPGSGYLTPGPRASEVPSSRPPAARITCTGPRIQPAWVTDRLF